MNTWPAGPLGRYFRSADHPEGGPTSQYKHLWIASELTIRQLGLRREDMRFFYARSTSPCRHASNSSPARESDQIGFLRNAGGVDRRSRDPETVVSVFELRWNARSRRCSGNFNLVAPGATSRRSASGVGRPLRISFRRIPVVVGVVPVGTPFMNVFTQIVESVSIWCIPAYYLRPVLPALSVIGKQFGSGVTPRIKRVFAASERCALPLGFGRQAIGTGSRAT